MIRGRGFINNGLYLGSRLDKRGRVKMTGDERAHHLYVAGVTGSGKSKFIEDLIRQDIAHWHKHRCGMLLLDPHGAMYNDIIRWCAATGFDKPKIVPIDLTRNDMVVGYNPLRQGRTTAASVLVSELVAAMAYVFEEAGVARTPLFATVASSALYALHRHGRTFPEIVHLLGPDKNTRLALTRDIDGLAAAWWDRAHALPDRQFDEDTKSTFHRIRPFLENVTIDMMLGSPHVSFDFGQAIEEGWIVLVNLSTRGGWGHPTHVNALGTLMLTDAWAAARDRGKESGKVKPFRIVLDEFQRFITPTIADNLAEARGFGLQLTLATQFPDQLRANSDQGELLYQNVMGNALSKVVFATQNASSLRALTEWLFMNTVNPDLIKSEIRGTKVVGQYVDYENADVESATDVSGGSFTTTTTNDSDAETLSESEARGDTWSAARSTSQSRVPMMKSVFGKEVSSREYRSVDEQFFLAMQKVFSQSKRHAYVRTATMTRPIAMRTTDVKPGRVSNATIEAYTRRLVEKLPFAISIDEARRLAQERRALPETLLNRTDEPESSRRRIK